MLAKRDLRRCTREGLHRLTASNLLGDAGTEQTGLQTIQGGQNGPLLPTGLVPASSERRTAVTPHLRFQRSVPDLVHQKHVRDEAEVETVSTFLAQQQHQTLRVRAKALQFSRPGVRITQQEGGNRCKNRGRGGQMATDVQAGDAASCRYLLLRSISDGYHGTFRRDMIS